MIDTFPINGTDHLEFYVGNAKQSALYYQAAFGFEWVAYMGPETGVRDRVSYVLQQNKIRLVLTASLTPDHEIARHVALHGDGVKVLALWVDDAEKAYYTALERGAESAYAPKTLRDDEGEVVMAAIKTYGDTIHISRGAPELQRHIFARIRGPKSVYPVQSVGLQYVDHCVGNVELGAMNKWVKFYEDVMGFKLLITFDDKDISTEYSALMSKVAGNGNGYIKFPINEPAKGKKKSQIEEYLDFYRTAGVQHIAVATNDIIATVSQLRANGVDFLHVPETYYEDVIDRVGHIEEDLRT